MSERRACTTIGADRSTVRYPIATYQAVDTFENVKRERHRFREEHPALTVDIKLDEMTQEDRSRAEQILRRVT